jgi:hypothetical protein
MRPLVAMGWGVVVLAPYASLLYSWWPWSILSIPVIVLGFFTIFWMTKVLE